MRNLVSLSVAVLAATALLTPLTCSAQSNNQSIFSDELDNGYQDWSWAPHSLYNTSPVESGAYSISVAFSPYSGLFFHNNDESTAPYTALQFYINGGSTGGEQFDVAAIGDTNSVIGQVPITNYVSGGVIPPNTWVEVTIPLSDLNASNIGNYSGIWLQDTTGGNQPTFYVDNISLIGVPIPTNVTASVNTGQVLQTVNSYDFGVNTAIWDSDFDSTTVVNLLKQTPLFAFRYPGGSAADNFDWTKAEYNGMPETKDLISLVSSLNASPYITLNYGTGTPQEAAAWAAYCDASPKSTFNIGVDSNGRNWYTAGYWASLRAAAPLAQDDGLNILRASHSASFLVSRFEVGNECYGNWEADTHSKQQDPVLYAQFFKQTQTLIKSIYPSALVGAVVTADEDSWGNQTETVTNPVTGALHKGWTSVLFSTLNGTSTIPDFVIYHNYPEGPGSESDYTLLHNSSNWSGAATGIRTMLTDYFSGAAARTKLNCTENNSVSYNPGKQTTSIVNGLYYADSFGSLIQTEFSALLWWNLHNGIQTGDNNSSGLYGWRQYGDYGILASGGSGQTGATQDTPYPTFLATELLGQFASNNDSVLPATTSYQDLTVYATKSTTGNLKLLVINKNATASFSTTLSISGYSPASTATEYTYGIPQDSAQESGATAALSKSTVAIPGSSFTQSFGPYSMTVIQLTPAG